MFRLARPLFNVRALLRPSSLSLLAKRASSPSLQVQAFSAPTAFATSTSSANTASVWKSRGGIALAGLGLGLAAFQIKRRTVLCDAPPAIPATVPPRVDPKPEPAALPPPPRSSLKICELGFGTVAGICAGVFIKKGAKALAFLLGGVFVMLQYFASLRLVRVNWSSAESRFQDMFYSQTMDVGGQEVRRPPTVYTLWRWLVDFLTADFPPRATFIAGMALGLRLG